MIFCNTDLEGVDARTVEVFRAFRAAGHAQRQLLDKALSAKGSHPAEAMALRALEASPGITQKDLAELLHLSRPRVTAVLQDLERRGFVRRHADEEDQRLTRVHLTEPGRQRSAELRSVFSTVLQRTIGALSGQELSDLERLLQKLAAQSSRVLKELDEGSTS